MVLPCAFIHMLTTYYFPDSNSSRIIRLTWIEQTFVERARENGGQWVHANGDARGSNGRELPSGGLDQELDVGPIVANM